MASLADHVLSMRPSADLTTQAHRQSLDSQISADGQITTRELKELEAASGRSSLDVQRRDVSVERVPTPAKSSFGDKLARFIAFAKTQTALKIFACNVAVFVAGWSDGSTGTLIPLLERHYNIRYLIVSLLFIGQAFGSVVASLVNTHITGRFGLGKVLVLGASMQMLAFGVLTSRPPYPAVIVIYAVNGFGLGIQDAQANAYIAGLPNAAYHLGILHGVYGVGALCAPIAGTAFAKAGINFFFFYLIGTGLAAVDIATAILGFRLKPENYEDPTAVTAADTQDIELEARYPHPPQQTEVKVHDRSKDDAALKEVLSNAIVWKVCIWLVVYVGAEVTLGGWIPSFLASKRGGGTDSGLVATGFWAGITLSRLLFPPLNLWVGEKRIIYIYTAVAIVMEILVWFVPQFIANSVFLAIVGLCLGPFYPIAINILCKLLPRHLHTAAVGFCCSSGQIGAAIFPFTVGALAQSFDLWVLQPVVLGMLVVIAGIWVAVPNVSRRSD